MPSLKAEFRFFDIPIRSDETLCEPGEIWFETPKGKAVRIWPPTPLPQGEGDREPGQGERETD